MVFNSLHFPSHHVTDFAFQSIFFLIITIFIRVVNTVFANLEYLLWTTIEIKRIISIFRCRDIYTFSIRADKHP